MLCTPLSIWRSFFVLFIFVLRFCDFVLFLFDSFNMPLCSFCSYSFIVLFIIVPFLHFYIYLVLVLSKLRQTRFGILFSTQWVVHAGKKFSFISLNVIVFFKTLDVFEWHSHWWNWSFAFELVFDVFYKEGQNHQKIFRFDLVSINCISKWHQNGIWRKLKNNLKFWQFCLCERIFNVFRLPRKNTSCNTWVLGWVNLWGMKKNRE